MLKDEFDKKVGFSTDPTCYERIEKVYMTFDELFSTQQDIVRFYKKYDMNGIEKLYREALKIDELHNTINILNNNLTRANMFFKDIENIAKVGNLNKTGVEENVESGTD